MRAVEACHRRERSLPLCWGPSSASNKSPVCIAERTMTGKAVAYLSAFAADLRPAPFQTSLTHCLNRITYGKAVKKGTPQPFEQ